MFTCTVQAAPQFITPTLLLAAVVVTLTGRVVGVLLFFARDLAKITVNKLDANTAHPLIGFVTFEIDKTAHHADIQSYEVGRRVLVVPPPMIIPM